MHQSKLAVPTLENTQEHSEFDIYNFLENVSFLKSKIIFDLIQPILQREISTNDITEYINEIRNENEEIRQVDITNQFSTFKKWNESERPENTSPIYPEDIHNLITATDALIKSFENVSKYIDIGLFKSDKDFLVNLAPACKEWLKTIEKMGKTIEKKGRNEQADLTDSFPDNNLIENILEINEDFITLRNLISSFDTSIFEKQEKRAALNQIENVRIQLNEIKKQVSSLKESTDVKIYEVPIYGRLSECVEEFIEGSKQSLNKTDGNIWNQLQNNLSNFISKSEPLLANITNNRTTDKTILTAEAKEIINQSKDIISNQVTNYKERKALQNIDDIEEVLDALMGNSEILKELGEQIEYSDVIIEIDNLISICNSVDNLLEQHYNSEIGLDKVNNEIESIFSEYNEEHNNVVAKRKRAKHDGEDTKVSDKRQKIGKFAALEEAKGLINDFNEEVAEQLASFDKQEQEFNGDINKFKEALIGLQDSLAQLISENPDLLTKKNIIKSHDANGELINEIKHSVNCYDGGKIQWDDLNIYLKDYLDNYQKSQSSNRSR